MPTAIVDMLASPESSMKQKPTPAPSTKRPHTSIFTDLENEDSENIDPCSVSSKRSKGSDGTPTKKNQPLFVSTEKHETFVTTRSPLSFPFDTPRTPTSPLQTKSTPAAVSLSLAAGSLSAPAGRSPRHKRIGILSRKRTSLSPFKRVEPPSFGAQDSTGGFSIDSALSGTLSGYSKGLPKSPILEDIQPKGWFFDIHEDTAEEEATNLMEHSACTLDISSDDEAGPAKHNDKGKENIPPPDHPESTSMVESSDMPSKTRRNAHADAMTDVGEDRAPLGALSAHDFYPEGLDAKSIAIVAPDADEEIESVKKESGREEADTTAGLESVMKAAVPMQRSHNMIAIAEDAEEACVPLVT